MWRMKCPKCGRPIKWWPDDLFQPICDKKKCVHCEEVLELTNPGVCSVINGLIFSGILVGLTFVGLGWQWLRVLAAGLVCWFIHPFIVQLLGRWSSHAYRAEDLGAARAWAIVGAASWWIFGIAVALMVIGFGLSYRDLLAGLSSWEGAIESQAFEDFTGTLRSWLPIGVGVALVAFVLAKVAAIRKSQLRNDQLREGTK
jgi:hypothetical protein